MPLRLLSPYLPFPEETSSNAARSLSSGTRTGRSRTAMSDTQLLLRDFEPQSMLQVPSTRVTRSRFPVIDFHTHLTWSNHLDHVCGYSNCWRLLPGNSCR